MSVTGFGRVIGGSSGGLIKNNQWFGDGSDGVGVINDLVEIPVTEDSGHILLQYKTLRIGGGGTLTPSARCAGMTILVQGDCVIDGVIDLDKKAPRLSSATETDIQTIGDDAHIVTLTAGSTGGNGGYGNGNALSNYGLGGNGFWCGGGYGGGGASWYRRVTTGDWSSQNGTDEYTPDGGDSEPRPPISIAWPASKNYGAGGYRANTISGGLAPGGGGSYISLYRTYTYSNGVDSTAGYYESTTGDLDTVIGDDGDAYGGGALWLVVAGNLTLNGTITAKGGNGGGGYYGAGGGGGGIVMLLARKGLFNNGSVVLTGGACGKGRNAYGLQPTRNGEDGHAGTLLTGHIALDGTVSWD